MGRLPVQGKATSTRDEHDFERLEFDIEGLTHQYEVRWKLVPATDGPPGDPGEPHIPRHPDGYGEFGHGSILSGCTSIGSYVPLSVRSGISVQDWRASDANRDNSQPDAYRRPCYGKIPSRGGRQP
jgi:hypothetical protein